ncbi:hypothetical protein GOBAR_AA35539 [Gossypium barbadense]|uniref:NB-ARC domain-containing protein n=1 Tax=Gossypium barbadense TaxID=3634 RepID=A0A2P5W256_GOSBA|nr:hypothetical protein GOBAR_AA35539 [Gossypium barbadense]
MYSLRRPAIRGHLTLEILVGLRIEAIQDQEQGISQDHLKLDLEMIANIILPIAKANPKVVVPVLIANIRSQFNYTPSYRIAGIGKTTVAKLVYNHVQLRRQFDVKFWICVSDDFVKRILRQMLEHFVDEKTPINQKKWENLKPCLVDVNKSKGNQIIATTRSEVVALKVQDCDHLSEIPRLDGFACLKELMVHRCAKLKYVAITGDISSLELLSFDSCSELQWTGNGLSTCVQLQSLSIWFCPNLSLVSVNNELSSLKELNLTASGEEGLSSEIDSIGSGNLISFPEHLGKLHSLVYLNISWCRNLRSILEDSLANLSCLTTLKMGGFWEELEEFPCVKHLSLSIQDIHLIGWRKLTPLPRQSQNLTAIRVLSIERFDGLEALPVAARSIP